MRAPAWHLPTAEGLAPRAPRVPGPARQGGRAWRPDSRTGDHSAQLVSPAATASLRALG